MLGEPAVDDDGTPPGAGGAPAAAGLLLDVCLTIALAAFAACLDAGLVVAPPRVDVLVTDPAFSRAPVADGALRAPPAAVASLAGLLLPLTLLATDFCVRRTRAERSLARLVAYALGAALVVLACGALRAAAGGAAPDFLAACAPLPGVVRVRDAAADCATPPSAATRASFPSTPAALAVYATTLFALYARAHWGALTPGAATALQVGAVIGGAAAAAAQVADARAHAGDAVAAVAIGAALAALVQARAFGGLARSFAGEDASELAEFLAAAAAAAVPAALVPAGGAAGAGAHDDAARAGLPLALRADPARYAPPGKGRAALPEPPRAVQALPPRAAPLGAPLGAPPQATLVAPQQQQQLQPPLGLNPIFSPAAIRARMAEVHRAALGDRG